METINPFGNIALSLSGGGFRAASFSLGTLQYLQHVNYEGGRSLLDNVSFISSTSGGSITAITYALSVQQEMDFNRYMRRVQGMLSGDNVLKEALKKLNDDSVWPEDGEGKKRTLINAFSMVYDDLFFDGAVFGDLCVDGACSVCFNSTEFYSGISFRFQHDNVPGNQGMFGNSNITCAKDNLFYTRLKLADILAASSCFPGGFEPIVMPYDFAYKDLKSSEIAAGILARQADENREPLGNSEIALMDGGIDDNQGLYSTMLADKRRGEGQKFDTVLVGDVTTPYMDPYTSVKAMPLKGWRSQTLASLLVLLKKVKKYITIAALTFLVLAIACLWGAITARDTDTPILLALLSGMLLTLFILFLAAGKLTGLSPFRGLFSRDPQELVDSSLEQVGAARNFSGDIKASLAHFLSFTPLGTLELMIKSRLSSLLVLSMDVNLKHTRRLIYEMFFKEQAYKIRGVYSAAFDLSITNKPHRIERISNNQEWLPTPVQKDILLLGIEKMEPISERARNMGTTLWFSQKEMADGMLRDLVACGNYTACANLLKHAFSLERLADDKKIYIAEDKMTLLKNIQASLLADWIRFKEDPYFLYDLKTK